MQTRYTATLAQTDQEKREAYALRHHVFVRELGGQTEATLDRDALEYDRFDTYCDHLSVRDMDTGQVVATTRLLGTQAAVDGYYSEREFDLDILTRSGLKLLEIGRTCVHPAHRTGAALIPLWAGLSSYVSKREIDVLFGVASFHGTDARALAAPLEFLHDRHLAPAPLRVTARGGGAQTKTGYDRVQAVAAVPSLIKTYLRMGGVIGQGYWVDHAFNTTDICIILKAEDLHAYTARFARMLA